MEFFKDFFQYMKMNKKLWLLPIVVTLMMLGGLILVSSQSVVAPFIYTLF